MVSRDECGHSPEDRMLAERTLRALAVAQLRNAQYDLAKAHLAGAMGRSYELHAENFVWGERLRETISSVAREQLAAGHTAVEMVIQLHEIIDEAALDRRIRREVEPDVVSWAIEAYFAA
jgi:hypothetical protein